MTPKIKNKIVRYTGFALGITGIILLLSSFFYEKYANEAIYRHEIMKISYGPDGDEEFAKLTKQFITPKLGLEDYGLTGIITGLCLIWVASIGVNRIKSPDKKYKTFIIGILASTLSTFGYIAGLFLSAYRGIYPPWADSLGIPLMSAPFMLAVLFLWVAVCSIALLKNFETSMPLFSFRLGKLVNIFYFIVLCLTVIIVVLVIGYGNWEFIIPGFLWIYFYLSILAGQRSTKAQIV